MIEIRYAKMSDEEFWRRLDGHFARKYVTGKAWSSWMMMNRLVCYASPSS